jgi:hypothetical protein
VNSTINKKTASDVGFEVLKVEGDILQHADFQQTTWCYITENRINRKKTEGVSQHSTEQETAQHESPW